MAIGGWSYGGDLSAWAVAHPDCFRTAIGVIARSLSTQAPRFFLVAPRDGVALSRSRLASGRGSPCPQRQWDARDAAGAGPGGGPDGCEDACNAHCSGAIGAEECGAW
ncbi:hypothetical protein [Xanthomonas graminis]|uniref:hypothetical protein n=1 Tax=Xanthomonas graminis TaxID=3390026 RepID=UPI0011152CD0|nr:hypothetical protein [Xanthomonas translucens]UKE56087.1 hypothetical protein KFS84_02985 [Xanthomonas translucens pv. graminis]WIH10401.1 hypothetical protein KM579_03580 [Xanthomonas translucens pv. graminis]WIH14414.1 hypothetical protein KM563_18230 [Xanthomonas translucens pv. graminis]WIH18081.1 hypothetical protein KM433_18055 [Xanthomonas translucens pv. graminis]